MTLTPEQVQTLMANLAKIDVGLTWLKDQLARSAGLLQEARSTANPALKARIDACLQALEKR